MQTLQESLLTGLDNHLHNDETLMQYDIVKYFKSSKVKVRPYYVKEFLLYPAECKNDFKDWFGDAPGVDRAAEWFINFQDEYWKNHNRYSVLSISDDFGESGYGVPVKELPATFLNKIMPISKLKTICKKYPKFFEKANKYTSNTSKFVITEEPGMPEEPYILLFCPSDIEPEDEAVWTAMVKKLIKTVKS